MSSSITAWRLGKVSGDAGCLGVQYGVPAGASQRDWIPIALVAPPVAGVADVEFLVERAHRGFANAVEAVEEELQFYLVEKGEPDPWDYLSRHHVGQLANEYGRVQWGYFSTPLAAEAFRFTAHLRTFVGIRPAWLAVSELRKNPNWDWGYGYGVYCFVDETGAAAYVGRALGKTLGERIAEHLRSDDPEWVEATSGANSLVAILTIPDGEAFMGSALEAFLIERLEPRINRHRQ